MDHSYVKEAIDQLLLGIGEDPYREGLRETASRAAKAWETWTIGYRMDPTEVMKTFESDDYNEMIVVKDIPIYSKCEHHLADIFGTATIGYIPNGRILGLSKLSRVADIFARRLQVQERLTVEIANALMDGELQPLGVGVVLKCRHMCMESRGINKQGHHTITSALRGVITNGQSRSEFLTMALG